MTASIVPRALVMRALDWMKENDPTSYDEALEAFRSGDVETLEELVAGVPDSASGRDVGGSLDD